MIDFVVSPRAASLLRLPASFATCTVVGKTPLGLMVRCSEETAQYLLVMLDRVIYDKMLRKRRLQPPEVSALCLMERAIRNALTSSSPSVSFNSYR